jgi:Asp-tRNA(Asn)/Glu-tRNA(Gln) amidotransferase B subunit
VEFLSKIDSIMRLLDICSILTGARPAISEKALSAGVNINNINTMKDVKQALAFLKSNQ